MRKYFYIIWVLILMGMGQFAMAQTTLAVLDLNSLGALTKSEERTLTDRLRLMLLRSGNYKMREQTKLDAALKRAGLHFVACITPDCAIKTGKILKVDQLITGSLGKIGDLYTIDLVLVDVAEAQVLKTVTRDYEGKIEGLIKLMQPIAEQITSGAEPELSPALEFGNLVVNTVPVPAEVFLNDSLIGSTPIRQEKVPAGEHKIRVSASGYVAVDSTIAIENDAVTQLQLSLVESATLTLISEPVNAQVII
jgi:hypothetical protein